MTKSKTIKAKPSPELIVILRQDARQQAITELYAAVNHLDKAARIIKRLQIKGCGMAATRSRINKAMWMVNHDR